MSLVRKHVDEPTHATQLAPLKNSWRASGDTPADPRPQPRTPAYRSQPTNLLASACDCQCNLAYPEYSWLTGFVTGRPAMAPHVVDLNRHLRRVPHVTRPCLTPAVPHYVIYEE